MSLIERAIHKLGAHPPLAPAPTDRGAVQTGATIERVATRIPPAQDEAGDVVTADPPPRRDRIAEMPAPPAYDLPPLHVDIGALRTRGFATSDGANPTASREFRVIKRPLLTNAFGTDAASRAHGRRILVTSSLPGEGKSHCAINLALSVAAERDHQVLLVDADVARPSIPRHLGIEPGAGLMDWLVDGSPDLGELVRRTDIDKLSILQAGRAHEHATELLASAAMTRLLDELAMRFPDRFVIFDSPPLLVTTEARVLASYMGQIVMVVEAGRTPRSMVDEALGMIPREQLVGLVLNKSSEGSAGSYYGYQGQAYGATKD